MKISKRKCYEIAKQFCDLEDDYMMGIIFHDGNLEIGMIVPDLVKDKKVLYGYDTFLSKPNKKTLAEYLYRKVAE